MIYGIDVKLPGMLNAAIKACPGVRRQAQKLRCRQGRHHARASRRSSRSATTRVAVVADTWWHAKTALEALPIVWESSANAKVSSASIAEFLKDGLDAEQAFVGNQRGDVKAALAGAAKTVEAVYSLPLSEPRHDGADERHRALHRRTSARSGRRRRTASGAARRPSEASGLPVAKCESTRHILGGGFGRRGNSVDYVRQAVAIAKQMPGTPIKLIWSREEDMHARLLSPGHAVQDDGRLRRREEPDGAAHAHFRPVDPRRTAARAHGERHGPGDLPGLPKGGRGGVRL